MLYPGCLGTQRSLREGGWAGREAEARWEGEVNFKRLKHKVCPSFLVSEAASSSAGVDALPGLSLPQLLEGHHEPRVAAKALLYLSCILSTPLLYPR